MSALTVLSAHNFYREPGGEDAVFAAEIELLRAHGHAVTVYERSNHNIRSGGAAAFEAIWSRSSHRDVRSLAGAGIAHFHNTFPLISPSAYYAAASQGSAVVQTLHNYRLICPGALLSRNGAPCEECLTQNSLRPALSHSCYRDSRAATAGVAAMLTTHRAAGTYQRAVDAYIALSEFARTKFVAGGLPANRIFVKPNFVPDDPGTGAGSGHYALFAGRLSPEKGVATLTSAWNALPDVPLKVLGDGPLNQTSWPSSVTAFGAVTRQRVLEQMRNATALVFPSTCYENAPMSILEAFSCGTPVITSNLGSMAELVRDGYNGLLFRPGDPADLAAKVRYAFDNPEHLATMRANARREFEEKYTADRNYKMLIAIYEQAIETRSRLRRAS
ncbi:MAG: glycosyltransferase family 4 protein [Acidobacteriota bacterium]